MKKNQVIQCTLLGAGLLTFVFLSDKLERDGRFEHEPNVLTLKGSPFGRTLALAMRGPVDVYWHRGAVHDHDHGDGHDHGHSHGPEGHSHGAHSHGDHSHDEPEKDAAFVSVTGDEDHGHSHGPDGHSHGPHGHSHGDDGHSHGELDAHFADLEAHLDLEPDHGHDHGHHHGDEERPPLVFNGEVRPFMLDVIENMRKAYYSRSNTRGDTAMHKAFIMSETERRLSLSYQMDPSNIACYGSYFLFLSEALARVEGREDEHHRINHGRQKALALANFTMQYCMKQQDEASAMITGATAAHDYLQIYLSLDQINLKQAEAFLGVMDQMLGQYEAIRAQMQAEGTWVNYGEHRLKELEGAYSLVAALRKVDYQQYEKRKAAAEQ